ncbi:MAG: phage portal protein, partial [Nitrososphaeria archaeon]|nr:phage portal protein [Nitrososphaeria archaeon]
ERRITNQPEFFIYWSDDEHFTLDQDGNKVPLDPEKGDEQFINPTGVMPVITIQKDRDDEYWATQGEDMVDLTIAAQLGWSDLLTIAKHQGFSLLTIGSEEEPTSQEIGLNKAIWLKLKEGSPTPFVEYAQASSPIEQYKQMILDLIGMMLSTNDMNPKELAGALNAQSVTSGAQALIEMADTLEAREESKPVFRDAEKELWDTLAAWHNWAHDIQGMLPPDLQALGKFSEGFTVSIQYQDIKPIESEQERLMVVEKLRNMGLITKLDAIKKLNPDLSDDEIEAKLEEIKEESMAQAAAFGLPAPSEEEEPAEEEEDGTEES